jgi:cof-like hydrolase
MKYDLIFSDFDGTLLKDDFTVGRRNADAIKNYIARGGHFVVCTGRMSSSIDPWKEFLGIGNQRIAVAGFQGTHISDTSGRLLYCDYVNPDTVYKILKKGEELEVYTHFYDSDTVYIREENEINLEYARITGAPLKVVGNLADYISAHRDLKVIKIMVVVEASRADAVKAEYAAMGLDGVQFYMSSDVFLEFVSSVGGKGSGLKKVAEFLGVPMSRTIAVGDNQNDISMIKAAGLGIAVSNAREEVKQAADYVTVSNNEDAIAEVIEKFCGD